MRSEDQAPKLIKVEARCPFCGAVQSFRLSNRSMFGQAGRYDVVLCDSEEIDGCDTYFVLHTRLEFVATSYAINETPHSIIKG